MNTETFERLLKQAVPDGKTIREIRIRTEKPVMILLENGVKISLIDTHPVLGYKKFTANDDNYLMLAMTTVFLPI